MMIKISFALVLFLLATFSWAQYPDFLPPVDGQIILNGNFGELRANHFHAGIDIKTKEPLSVHSVDDGFVVRVSVSSKGYGNSIYVQHPSGYTTVYAHLLKFSPDIAHWVEEQQYKEKSFEVNLFPEKDQFKLKRGQEIAISGNTGSSAGPHLHFEIRKSNNEHPVNPLFFHFDIKDKTKPSVENLYIYPLGDRSQVKNKIVKQHFKLVFYGGAFHLKGIQTLPVFGKIGFGVDAIDYLDNNWSKCGIYQMEYWVDNDLINSFELNELDYSKMRYCNSHMDYETYKQKSVGIHKTFIESGNHLDIYHQSKNGGVFNFDDGERHDIQIKLYDVNMNAVEIQFYVKSTTPVEHPKNEASAHFNFDTSNSFSTNDIQVHIPDEALYTDLNFIFKKGKTPTGAFSPLFRVHNQYTPLQKRYELKIKVDKLPRELESKTLISLLDIDNGHLTSLGGKYVKGWVTTNTYSFGDVCVAVDTIAPSIRSLSIKDNHLVEQNQIRFKIDDDLSGIDHYEGTIDGKWVLFEYDAKRDLLVYHLSDRINKRCNHQLKLMVSDRKNNSNVFKTDFFY